MVERIGFCRIAPCGVLGALINPLLSVVVFRGGVVIGFIFGDAGDEWTSLLFRDVALSLTAKALCLF